MRLQMFAVLQYNPNICAYINSHQCKGAARKTLQNLVKKSASSPTLSVSSYI